MTILFVDDLIEEIEAFAQNLRDAGYTVVPETDAGRALERLKTEEYDLAIIDIMMPPGPFRDRPGNEDGMLTGACLLEDVKSFKPDLPIIMLTNVNGSDVLEPLYRFPRTKVVRKTEVGYPWDALPNLVARFVRPL